jgi:hypothetical protein
MLAAMHACCSARTGGKYEKLRVPAAMPEADNASYQLLQSAGPHGPGQQPTATVIGCIIAGLHAIVVIHRTKRRRASTTRRQGTSRIFREADRIARSHVTRCQ